VVICVPSVLFLVLELCVKGAYYIVCALYYVFAFVCMFGDVFCVESMRGEERRRDQDALL